MSISFSPVLEHGLELPTYLFRLSLVHRGCVIQVRLHCVPHHHQVQEQGLVGVAADAFYLLAGFVEGVAVQLVTGLGCQDLAEEDQLELVEVVELADLDDEVLGVLEWLLVGGELLDDLGALVGEVVVEVLGVEVGVGGCLFLGREDGALDHVCSTRGLLINCRQNLLGQQNQSTTLCSHESPMFYSPISYSIPSQSPQNPISLIFSPQYSTPTHAITV